MDQGPTLHNPHLEGGAFFWEAGPVGGFLCHGLTATAAEVRTLARRLHRTGHTVAGPLLPGHGTTPEDLNRTHWHAWVEAGEETYQQLASHCEQVFVGGESMGALTALYLASEHPEAAGVLTYAPAIRLNLRRRDWFMLQISAPFVPSVAKSNWEPCPGWQGYRVNPLRAALQVPRLQQAVRRRLPLIQQPIFVVQGRQDSSISPNSGRIVCAGVSSVMTELHWMENSAHTVILDREFEEVVDLSLRFLKRVLDYHRGSQGGHASGTMNCSGKGLA